jgi:DNA-binding NtrC family response regulator/tetratricopeptide (TPR) repeat protein
LSIISEKSGPEAAIPLLGDLRRTTTKIGDPEMTGQLHLFVAEMEAKRGLLDSAVRHVGLAQELVAGVSNLWLSCLAQNVLLAVCVLRSDVEAGRKHSTLALGHSEECGAAAAKRSAAANTGNLLFIAGDFQGAYQHFQKALTLFTSNGSRQHAILDALAQVALAQNNLDECNEFLSQIDSQIVRESDRGFYAHRYAEVTRAKLQIKQNRLGEAILSVSNALNLAAIAQDYTLLRVAFLIKAEVFQRLGKTEECLKWLRLGIEGLNGQSPETFSRFEQLVGRGLTIQCRADEAKEYLLRAKRISEVVTNVPALLEAEPSASASTQSECLETLDTRSADERYQGFLHALALITLHSSRPDLVGRELAQILVASNCALGATVRKEDRDGSSRVIARVQGKDPIPILPMRQFKLGNEQRGFVEISLCPSTSIEGQTTLSLIAAVVDRLNEMERIRIDAERRSTLWPPDETVIVESGAIVAGEMRAVMLTAQKVAQAPANVLITGESGTGKEIIARAIHEFSGRAQKPFIPLNCAAVPRDLLESQLFGYRRGAFTGADRDQLGIARNAAGGTLFLDEIGEMSLELQPKLLRFLESGEIAPLGEPSPVRIDVRVVAATNASLEEAVRAGKFREDLFYRLNVVRLNIKPIRERRDEIPGMVNHFVTQAAREFKKGYLEVAEETMERLILYRWPGNVRQLQNEIRRMVALAEPNSTLEQDAISPDILAALPRFHHTPVNGNEIAVPLNDTLKTALGRVETEMVRAALRANHGRLEPAAKSLGISRKGLYLKRQRLGL